MRAIFAVLTVVLLAGCLGPMNDMMANDFATVASKPVPEGVAGVWTGTSGPWLMTVKLSEDGTGISCQTWNERQSLGKVKYDGSQIRFQSGGRLDIESAGNGKLQAKAPYFGANTITFVSDTDLREASPYCQQQMHSRD